ncbi:MAG TPA: class I SAM-dependent methyltransferase [Planctomycetaceae bacterium]|nr:class I SAM-dependent methyltransferase [Planctomycetaceae bacterium]
MSTAPRAAASLPVAPRPKSARLPDYADELAAFHRAFAVELDALVDSVPLGPQMRVLDVGCGDGFYMGLFSKRLMAPGGVVGLDVNCAFLRAARERLSTVAEHCEIDFVAGGLDDLPLPGPAFDLVWCSQSLFSFHDPVASLKQMAAAVRPGGFVAVLENDTLHQLLLPWSNRLEICLRAAELACISSGSQQSDKYYVGRRLPAVFAEAGLEPLAFKTQCIDRQTPLDGDLQLFLKLYLTRLAGRVAPYLNRALASEFADVRDFDRDESLLRRPFTSLTWLNMLAWGQRRS